MKQKFISLALAVMLLLGVTGCAMSTPASVGSIGGVDIPAGIYLLAQYNAYNTASGAAKLATGETASNVKAVLKAECTGTINGEEVTTDGADYVARLTLRSLQYYAAVEKKFDELGGTLDETATAEAAKTADTQWENNSDLYAANGISKATLEKYQLNSKKADACLELIYGENGSSPVTEQEYADYINNDCYYLELVQLPLFDQSTYTFASDDQKAEVVSSDEDLDLMGIIIVGTPDDNTDKLLVGTRAAVWAEAMRADGVILSSDGWGNSDVDFANTAEQMEIRGIPVTGLKFSGTVGQFVVENDHLGEILDINKSEEGIETDVLGENNVTELDAKKVTAMLKLKMRKNEKR